MILPKRQHLDDGPSTSNRYASLAHDENVADTNVDNTPTMPKPPPIFIPNVQDIGKMLNSINKVIESDNYHYKSLRDGQVRLSITTVDSFRKIVTYLDNSDIKFHTYQLKQERAFSVVIKGLHHSTPITDIKAKLLLSGHPVRNVRNIKSRTTKKTLPMFFVYLDPNSNNKDIYNMQSLMNTIIVVEHPKKFADIVQCFRCQQFGHTKSYCRNSFRCVKCGLEHSTMECTKTQNTPPQCVHC